MVPSASFKLTRIFTLSFEYLIPLTHMFITIVMCNYECMYDYPTYQAHCLINNIVIYYPTTSKGTAVQQLSCYTHPKTTVEQI